MPSATVTEMFCAVTVALTDAELAASTFAVKRSNPTKDADIRRGAVNFIVVNIKIIFAAWARY